MKDWKSQAHVKWERKFHIVFYRNIERNHLRAICPENWRIFREYVGQKAVKIEASNALPDHIQMLLRFPRKVA